MSPLGTQNCSHSNAGLEVGAVSNDDNVSDGDRVESNRSVDRSELMVELREVISEGNNKGISRKERGRRRRKNLHKYKQVCFYNSSSDVERVKKHQRQRCIMSKRNAKKKRGLPNTKKQRFLSYSGDVLTTQTEWPMKNKQEIFRVMGANVNGISSSDDLIEWDITLGHMMDLQVDCLCLTEPNLDLNSYLVKDTIRHATKSFDRHMHLTVTASSQPPLKRGSFYKPGGTITAVNGVWSGRVQMNLSTLKGDKYNRWGTTHLTGRHFTVTILTVYRVCAQRNGGGDNTIYLQQQSDLEIATGKVMDPRKSLRTDLLAFINQLHNHNHKVLLIGDMNEDLLNPKNDIASFLGETNMVNMFTNRHPHLSLPVTYDRGRACLDLMAMSSSLDPSIVVRMGYLPFYQPFASDHRAMFCDLDMNVLFGKCKPDLVRPVFRKFHTNNVKTSQKYLKSLEDKLSRSKIFQQVSELRQQIATRDMTQPPWRYNDLIQRCKTLETKVSELMKAANRSVGRTPYVNGYWCSNKIREAGHAKYCAKRLVRRISVGLGDSDGVSEEEARQLLAEATEQLRIAQASSRESRDTMLHHLSRKRAKEWRMEAESAIKIIQNAEKAKQQFAKISRSTKSSNHGSLRKVLVPSAPTNSATDADSDDLTQWTTIENPKHLHEVLLRRNAHHLSRSQHSMFARGPVQEAVGWDSQGPGIEDLLNGSIDSDTLGEAYPEFGNEASAFIRALRYPSNSSGQLEKEKFKWKFGLNEYRSVFKKTCEETACGPSGFHMSYWKVALERDAIAEVHAFFIWAAFELGFSYPRWEVSWHCMLQKKKRPYYHKLRIIQLFEGDFNAGLKFLLGRKLMAHLVKKKYITTEMYGSIPGRTAPEAMGVLQQVFDNHRLTRRNLLADFNDAAGCFDCIRHNLSSITMMRLGCMALLALCHCLAQLNMMHFVRTAAGISDGHITFNPDGHSNIASYPDSVQSTMNYRGNIGGVGQGGGGSPVIWLTVSMPMIETFHQFAEGAEIRDPLGRLTFSLWVLSYVDDNSLLRTFPDNTAPTDFWKTASKEFSSWHKLLQITGGDLALEKCTCTVMKWKWGSTYGIPALCSSKDFPGSIQVQSSLDPFQQTHSLHRLEPWEAQRQLGIRLPLTGSCAIEFEFRKNQCARFANSIKKAPLSRHEAYVHFRQYFIPALSFPFPVTLFTTSQCHELQRKYIFHLLPKLGINRHMPRITIYAPMDKGGAQLLDLRVLQPVHQLTTLQQHLRRQDATGQSLVSNAHALQVLLGSSDQFLDLDYANYSTYIDNNARWCYIWQISAQLDISIQSSFLWSPVSPYGERDIGLMDQAVSDPKYQRKHRELHAINACRLYLKVFFLSELTTYSGRYLQRGSLDGAIVNPHPITTFPQQPMPTKYQWGVWRAFLFQHFVYSDLALHPSFDPTSRARNVRQLPRHESIISKYRNVMSTATLGTPIEGVVSQLPPFFQYMLDGYQSLWDPKTTARIRCGILQGCIETATDGSLLQSRNRGSHGVAISIQGDRDCLIEGGARCPTSPAMSSLTTEHYGLLSLGVILHLVVLTTFTSDDMRTTAPIPPVTVYIDNQALVKRGAKLTPVRLTLKAHSVPDFDLWELTNEILKSLPFCLKCEWIKGHQDDTVAPVDLETPALLNIAADHQATTKQNHHSDIPAEVKPFLSQGVIGYYDKDGAEIMNLYHYIADKLHSPAMREYLIDKFQWTREIQSSIDWCSLSTALRALPVPQRLKQMQYLYNWQNVGQQKAQFAQSSMHSARKSHSPEMISDLLQCPMQCGSPETNGHYLLCSSSPATVARATNVATFRSILVDAKTCPGIVTWLTMALNGQESDLTVHEGGGTYFDVIGADLLESQTKVGWEALRRGFLSLQWRRLQAAYVQHELQSTVFDLDHWMTKIIQFIFQHGRAMWEVRNESLHGATPNDSRSLRLNLLRKRVRQLYHHEDRKYVPPSDRKTYFGLPVHQRCKQGLYALTSWIQFVERRLHFHREEAMKRTIHAWLERS